MKIRKVAAAPYHLANKLHGQKARARYGVFKDGVQVGFVCGTPLWEAYSMDAKTRLLPYSCGSLKQLKAALKGK